jgi:hypothetical protein
MFIDETAATTVGCVWSSAAPFARVCIAHKQAKTLNIVKILVAFTLPAFPLRKFALH